MANFSNLQSDLRKVFKSLYSSYDFSYAEVNNLIVRIGGAVAAKSYADFAKKFPNRAGIDEEWLASTFDSWRKNQIMRLMQAQQNEQLKIGRLINNARAEGKAHEKVAAAYAGDQARKHAIFEMRNASANLNAEINKNRMQEAGIDCYKWSTSGDDAVRDTHREMRNKICRFDDPSVYYDSENKIWKAREDDMVHKHPGEDYNCRCVALPYLMEIDDTGKHGKGIDKAEDIEEILHEEETEKIREDWIAELKASPDYIEENSPNLNYMLKNARALDDESKPFMQEYLESFRVLANSNAELRNMIAKNKLHFVFVKGQGCEFSGSTLQIDIACWLSGVRLLSKKMRMSTTLHELMHGVAAKNKKFNAYLKNIFRASQDDFKRFPEFAKIIESAKNGGKNMNQPLQSFWKQFIEKSFDSGNNHSGSGISNITDYTHGIISYYMNERQIQNLDMRKQLREAILSVNANAKDLEGAWHDDAYYIKNDNGKLLTVEKRIEYIADEFQANMGSLYFTDRKLFDSYKDILPNALSLVENFIKEGKYEYEQY
jgi:hypothetical protein